MNFENKKYYVFAALFFLTLTLIFFYKLVFHLDHIIFPAADITGQYLPWRYFFKNTFLSYYEISLWNPHFFSGTPFAANSLTALFYPLTWLAIVLPLHVTFSLQFILNVFLIGFFTFCFARTIGFAYLVSLFTGTIFMFSSPIITKIYAGHLANIDSLIFFPLLLIVCEKIIQNKQLIKNIVIGSLSAGLMILAGHPQYALYILTCVGIYILIRALQEGYFRNTKKLLRLILLLLTVLSLTILLASIQLLISQELSSYSVRQGHVSYTFASTYSLHPISLLTAFLPNFFGTPLDNSYWGKGNYWELSLYVGIVPLFLALLSSFTLKNKYTQCFLLLCSFSLMFSLGKYFLLFPFFYNFIPLFDIFRIPATMLFAFVFFICLLSGIGLSYLIKLTRYEYSKTIKLSALFICITLLMGIFSLSLLNTSLFLNFVNTFFHTVHPPISRKVISFHIISSNIELFVITFSLIISLIVLQKNKYVGIMLILLIAFVDIFYHHLPFIQTKPLMKTIVSSDTSQIKNSVNQYRVFDQIGTLHPFVYVRDNIGAINGYDPTFLSSYQRLLFHIGDYLDEKYEPFVVINSINNTKPLELLDVKYIFYNRDHSLEGYKKINSNTYEKIADINKVNFVTKVIHATNDKESLKKILKNSFNPKNEVILTQEAKYINIPTKQTPIYTNTVTPNSQVYSLHNPTEGYMVMNEIYYPGWKAYVNGRETPLLSANYIFRGVYLPAGQNTVEITYKPDKLYYGAYLTISGIIICLVLSIISTTKHFKLV